MREFRDQIFMGNGEFSRLECEKLKTRLQEGLNFLGALQQPGHSESEEETKEEEIWFRNTKMELNDIVLDIITALGSSVEELQAKTIPSFKIGPLYTRTYF